MTQVGDAPAPETTGNESPAETQPGPDLGPLLERMDQFGSQLGEVREQVGQQYQPEPQQGFEQQPQFDPAQQYGYPPQQGFGQEQFQPEPQYDPNTGQPLYEQYGQPQGDPYGGQQQQPQLDPEQVAEQLSQALGLDGIKSEVAQMRAARDAEMLKQKFPDLADREKVEGKDGQPGIRAMVEQRAMTIARGDQQLAESLLDSPDFWEASYLAGRAMNSAASETPAGGANEIQLETPGGTAPEQPQQDEGDLIVAAMDRRKPSW